ncbi:MAG: putative lipid II flippase FtsW [Clostridia bacterium]|nr:putative lipid II flippase FtsW [Clostridia bacterium]
MTKKSLQKRQRGDIALLIAVVSLSLIGTLFIYSASNYSADKTYGDKFYFVKKQLIGIVVGLVAMIFTAHFNYNKLKKFTPYVSVASIILLAIIFIPGVGVENYGARRWIGIGGLTIQPSEISKFALILFSAHFISNRPERVRKFKGILPILAYGGMTCLLIILEPNMSITMCVAMLMITMLFAGGMKIRHFIYIILPIVIGAVALIFIEPYRLKRLTAFLDPWSNPKGEGYQLLQSLYALGSGGWFGVGLFNSRQKYAFLPFAESDFILSVIGEEIGFVGLFFFFSLLGFIIYRGLKIASKSKDVFGYLLAVGITMIFGIQTVINALVVTGSIPPTGLPLPLVSSGNTSIIIFMAEMGVLYNISKNASLTF